MGYLIEEKALENNTNILMNNTNHHNQQQEHFNNNNNHMDSLEEQVYMFFGQEEGDHHDGNNNVKDDEFDSESGDSYLIKRNLYWESQESLLQEILGRSNMQGAKLRQEISRIIEQAKGTAYCNCTRASSDGYCPNCLRQKVVSLLCKKGFNASLCTSKWNHTKKFPGGTHEYIEVIVNTPGRKKQVPFLIELEFQDQFKIAKACDEYCNLVAQLPEYYIGKPEYLNAIVRVLCDAAKTSMKEKKLHMGPWRKRSFMEMKWSNSVERRPVEESSNKFSSSTNQTCEPYLPSCTAPAVAVS